MKRYDKLIFADKSDTSVAPMAEAIMQDLLRLDDILVESRGLVVLFPEPPVAMAEDILERHGLSFGVLGHASTPVTEQDFDERTLVLTMETAHKDKILEQWPEAVNLYTLGEYVGVPEDIEDPYGGAEDAYEQCYDRLRGMLLTLAETIKEEA